jgi:acetate---CoA ligase (ADP-forming)
VSRATPVAERVRGRDRIGALLAPRSIAVVGASPDPTKRGYQAVRTLLEDGYGGAIHPVHPRGGELLGLPVVRAVEELPPGVDLALICTPAATVPSLIDACGAAGVGGAVVLALGFGEIGGVGARLEDELRAAIARTGVRVVGPNTSGMANPWLKLSLIGVRGLKPGGLALLAQSGNVLLGMMLEAKRRPALGLSCVIGVGNAVDLGADSYLDWLADDERTRAIALYLEGIGHGRRFLDAAARAVARKPVVLLKGGRSAAGGAAARSHTGALTGEYAVMRAALREVGVLELDRSDELFPVAETLLAQPAAAGARGLAILSDGGGHATIAADRLVELDARLAVLGDESGAGLRARLGPTASVANPVDVAGATDRDPAAFADAVDTLLADDAVGALLVVGLFGGYAIRFAAELAAAELGAAERMAAAAKAAGKALIVHSMYADADSPALDALRAAGVPVCASLEVACRCAAALLSRDAAAARAQRSLALRAAAPDGVVPRATVHAASTDTARHASLGGAAAPPYMAAPPAALLEPALRALCEPYGVRFAPATFCTSAAAAAAAAASYGTNVAVRVVATGISHKTEAGGVRLEVAPSLAARAFDEIRDAAEAYAAGDARAAGFEGVMVGPMLPRPIAELLVGVRRDAVFGAVLAIGAGGTAVEVLRDIVLGVPPLDEAAVVRLIGSLRTAPLLRGWRGAASADERAVARIALGLLACAEADPALGEIELNPVFVYADRAVAIDVRGFRTAPDVSPPEELPASRSA